jgi:hypothetical protein
LHGGKRIITNALSPKFMAAICLGLHFVGRVALLGTLVD